MVSVVKRNKNHQVFDAEKLKKRIEMIVHRTKINISEKDFDKLMEKVTVGLKNNIKTTELEDLIIYNASSLVTYNYNFSKLASGIDISRLHKETKNSFLEKTQDLYELGLLNEEYYSVVEKNHKVIESYIDYMRDYNFDIFGIATLKKSYLLKNKDKSIIERPQDLFMRVAIAIHGTNFQKVKKVYDNLSNGNYIHATPTLFNAGTKKQNLSSCFLLQMKEDSIDGIYDTLKQCAKISQSAGGIGLSVHNVRASGSYIKGTNGYSNGLIPMLKVFNETARYVDQGGGRRKGSISIFLETWHSDIYEFLELKKNIGKEETRARDLFYAMWISDLFMERVEKNEDWSLFSPDVAVGLDEVYGDEFKELYTKYESEGKARKVVKARELWNKILESQIETGTPYMLYKDAANKKSNQQNLGTIKSSNLCAEILEYTSPDEVAVCNLASISLSKAVSYNEDGIPYVDYSHLRDMAYELTENLNNVIDINYYPVPEARKSNLRHRPIGIGVQGLADMFSILKIPFDSEKAREINKKVFANIYYGALKASNDLAKVNGSYETFDGSPASKGLLQFDLWNQEPDKSLDWNTLKENIKLHGLRNSLLLAPMPTASTSQILGNNECFEPFTSNLYTRGVLSGTFIVMNKYLYNDLVELGLWDEQMRQDLMLYNGSIQKIDRIPDHIKEIYKTVYEISQKSIIDMAADRGIYIDQTQSMNIFMDDINIQKLTSMHFYGWKKGLKTGMYYLRSRPAVDPIKFTLNKEVNIKKVEEVKPTIDEEKLACSIEAMRNGEECVLCSS